MAEPKDLVGTWRMLFVEKENSLLGRDSRRARSQSGWLFKLRGRWQGAGYRRAQGSASTRNADCGEYRQAAGEMVS